MSQTKGESEAAVSMNAFISGLKDNISLKTYAYLTRIKRIFNCGNPSIKYLKSL